MLKKIMLTVMGLALVAFVAIVAGCGTSTSAASTRTSVVPLSAQASLDGTYHQTKSGIPNIVMTAVVTNDNITITMTMSGTSGVFWDGTFDTQGVVSSPWNITSTRDAQAMSSDMYGSSEQTKTFTYNNGDLSYQFSILGVSTTVHMSK